MLVCDGLVIDFVSAHPHPGDPEQLMQFMVKHPDMITLDISEISDRKKMMQEIYVRVVVSCCVSYFTF